MFLDPCVILFTAVVSAFGWGCLNKGVSASRGSVSRGVYIHLRGLHPGGLDRHLLPIGCYGTQSTSGWYASYWNAFLFKDKIEYTESENSLKSVTISAFVQIYNAQTDEA